MCLFAPYFWAYFFYHDTDLSSDKHIYFRFVSHMQNTPHESKNRFNNQPTVVMFINIDFLGYKS